MTVREFSALILSQQDSLNSYAHFLTKDYNDACDLTQDTLLRALVKRDKFTVGSNARAWLCAIMKNTFVNNYRKNRRIVVADTSAAVAPLWHSTGSVSADTMARLKVKDVAKEVHKLPEHFRVPLELYYNGYRYQEIAEVMEQPIGTIKSRIHLAKKSLAKELEN